MTEFKKGDAVLVTLNGVDVPAAITYLANEYVEVTINDEAYGISENYVRLDPSKRKWAVGDVVETAEELTTLPDNAVFVDHNGAVSEWDVNRVWTFGSDEEFSADDIDGPATIIYVPKDV